MMMIVTKNWLLYIFILISFCGCYENTNRNKNTSKTKLFSNGYLFEVYLKHWTIPIEGCNFARFHFKVIYKNNSETDKKIKYVRPDLCQLLDTNTNFKLMIKNNIYPVYVYNDSIPPSKVNFIEIKPRDSLIIDLILINPVFYGNHSIKEIMSESKHLLDEELKILVYSDNKIDTLVSKKSKRINFYLNGELIDKNDSIKLNDRLVLPISSK